ncbi:MAG TPA: proline dehydrogenase [Deltaproteobacteria bacterium]|nr:proline dehydrogenase [Deltaproteobacteria bacterium]HCY11571.1 proline dehydrogenase [Deltaproteobacteria bacterium]
MKGILLVLAKRYIAGAERQDAIRTALALNDIGIKATIDNLGENVRTPAQAAWSVAEYLDLLKDIKASGADSQISLKLTHMGLDISPELAIENLETIVKKAREDGNFVRVDMEGSKYTQATIDIFLQLRKKYPNIGVALQSALKRSVDDARIITAAGGSIRIVKGAYKEPASIAFKDKREVYTSFEEIMKGLLLTATRPAIATHDERLLDVAKKFADENGVSKRSFDFEMLLGIKRSLQRGLAREGYSVRVYVPYGREWLQYTLRRLGERKENVWFVLKNIFD